MVGFFLTPWSRASHRREHCLQHSNTSAIIIQLANKINDGSILDSTEVHTAIDEEKEREK